MFGRPFAISRGVRCFAAISMVTCAWRAGLRAHVFVRAHLHTHHHPLRAFLAFYPPHSLTTPSPPWLHGPRSPPPPPNRPLGPCHPPSRTKSPPHQPSFMSSAARVVKCSFGGGVARAFRRALGARTLICFPFLFRLFRLATCDEIYLVNSCTT